MATEDVLLHLRPARADDETFLLALYLQAHAPGLDHFLGRMQWEAQRRGYAARFPDASDLILVSQGENVGRLLVCTQAPVYQVIDLAILPTWQGRGLGTWALGWALEQAQRCGLPTRLSVLEQNQRARRLYQSLGFRQVERASPYIFMEHPGAHASSTTES